VKRAVFSPQAKRDLQSIADYIAADNPLRALTFVGEIEARCFKLADFPRLARTLPELGAHAHILPHGNYVILYRDLPDEVSIERVVHGARDIMALLEDPG
jgi:toxin ParE1/3/4